MAVASLSQCIKRWSMFERLYVEALLADPILADQVWELWDAGVITDEMASRAWCILAMPERMVL